MITKFARLEFELFTKPSKSDFLRVHYFLVITIPQELQRVHPVIVVRNEVL
jgi:hypothetical protein